MRRERDEEKQKRCLATLGMADILHTKAGAGAGAGADLLSDAFGMSVHICMCVCMYVRINEFMTKCMHVCM